MQSELFPTDPSKETNAAPSVNVIFSSVSKVNSKEKIDFQKAIEKNSQLKSKIEYVKGMDRYAYELSHKNLAPTEDDYVQCLLDEVVHLDEAYANRLNKFTKRRKEKLAEIIVEKANCLVNEYECEQAERYLQKHLPPLDKEEERIVNEHTAMMFERITGIQFDMDDFKEGKPDFDKINEKYGDRINEYLFGSGTPMEDDRPKCKKTKKQIEREEKEQLEQKLLNADIQSIFKELAKKLHPDTELDESIKAKKQELMKELVSARDENDIFELLRLRLSVLADADNLNLFDQNSMKRLTKMIREKNRHLEGEIFFIQRQSPVLSSMGAIFMDEAKMKLNIEASIQHQKKIVQKRIKLMKENIQFLTASNQNLNKVIDQYELEDDSFYDMFDF